MRKTDAFFFCDVQARGYYPSYKLRELERKGITIPFKDDDKEILKNNTVDFLSFSYYATHVVSGDERINEEIKNNPLATLKNPYLGIKFLFCMSIYNISNDRLLNTELRTETNNKWRHGRRDNFKEE